MDTRFVDSHPPVETARPFKVERGRTILQVPVLENRLDWLRWVKIDPVEGCLKWVWLRDSNGSPIADVSGRSLQTILHGYLQLELDDNTGLGCLPNLSSACPYLLELEGDAKGTITYGGRPLQPITRENVPSTPPFPGAAQWWTEINDLRVYKGFNRLLETRVGATLRRIYCLHSPSLAIDDLHLELDGARRLDEFQPVDRVDDGLAWNAFTFDLPRGFNTVPLTILELVFDASADGSISLLVNDMIWPYDRV